MSETKRALITGLAGQDGVYLARHLTRLGYQVAGTVSSVSRSQPVLDAYLPDVRAIELDIRDSARLAEILVKSRPDEIYNLASWSSVGRSWGDPEQVTAINGLAVLGMLEQVKKLRDREGYDPRICQASSSEMFGLVHQLPQTETSPHHPRSPYAVSKSFAHHTVVNYRESYGMYVANAILFNHESPLRPASFVTRKITQGAAAIAQGRKETLTLGRLDVRRDWGAAADYVEALHLMLQHNEPDDFIIATGVSHSLEEFLEFAFRAAGVSDYSERLKTDPALLRPADVPETRGDATKALRALGWKPTRSLPELVNKMVRTDLDRGRTGTENDPSYL